MARAAVGDDVYGDDPTVNALEAKVAEILGKEAAVYVPTGTMANQLALRSQTEPGDAVIMDAHAHVVRNEAGAAAALSGVTVIPVSGRRGIFTAEDVHAAMGTDHPLSPFRIVPRTRLVCVENTHNGGGGVVWPLERIRAVTEAAREHGLSTHLDGARIWNASVASGIAPARVAEHFDSVSVCFSKGLGAPVGSTLAGTATLIARARRFRQQFGGGMRQAGIIAAGALYALEHNRARLEDDHRRAREFAENLAGMPEISIDLDAVQTNIVRFTVPDMGFAAFVDRCHDAGLSVLPSGGGVRAVFHLDVDDGQLARALAIVRSVLADAGRSDTMSRVRA